MLGIQYNVKEQFATESEIAKKTISKLDSISGQFEEHEQLIKQREEQAEKIKTTVPNKMIELFDEMLKLVDMQEAEFHELVQQTVEKQQQKIKSDISKRLPQFTSMVEKKYKMFMQ